MLRGTFKVTTWLSWQSQLGIFSDKAGGYLSCFVPYTLTYISQKMPSEIEILGKKPTF